MRITLEENLQDILQAIEEDKIQFIQYDEANKRIGIEFKENTAVMYNCSAEDENDAKMLTQLADKAKSKGVDSDFVKKFATQVVQEPIKPKRLTANQKKLLELEQKTAELEKKLSLQKVKTRVVAIGLAVAIVATGIVGCQAFNTNDKVPEEPKTSGQEKEPKEKEPVQNLESTVDAQAFLNYVGQNMKVMYFEGNSLKERELTVIDVEEYINFMSGGYTSHNRDIMMIVMALNAYQPWTESVGMRYNPAVSSSEYKQIPVAPMEYVINMNKENAITAPIKYVYEQTKEITRLFNEGKDAEAKTMKRALDEAILGYKFENKELNGYTYDSIIDEAKLGVNGYLQNVFLVGIGSNQNQIFNINGQDYKMIEIDEFFKNGLPGHKIASDTSADYMVALRNTNGDLSDPSMISAFEGLTSEGHLNMAVDRRQREYADINFANSAIKTEEEAKTK